MSDKKKFVKTELDLTVKNGESFEISLVKAKLQMLKDKGLITTKEQMDILEGFICGMIVE